VQKSDLINHAIQCKSSTIFDYSLSHTCPGPVHWFLPKIKPERLIIAQRQAGILRVIHASFVWPKPRSLRDCSAIALQQIEPSEPSAQSISPILTWNNAFAARKEKLGSKWGVNAAPLEYVPLQFFVIEFKQYREGVPAAENRG
jgi:hypothetical protein